jgi:hypothetical protein
MQGIRDECLVLFHRHQPGSSGLDSPANHRELAIPDKRVRWLGWLYV